MIDRRYRSRWVRRWRFTTLVFLVMFVFLVLGISMVFTGVSTMIMVRMHLLPSLSDNTFPYLLIFILMVSLVIASLLATLIGRVSLKPLRRFSDAADKVATGDFNVHVRPYGPVEMIRLANSFNAMARELGSIETLRTDFVNNVSHEFKTPVVSIRGFAKLLKKEGFTEAQRHEYLDIIIAEAERLATLSSNVLLLSKLESTDSAPQRAAYSLDEQLRKCILLLEPQMCRKSLELDIDLNAVEIEANEDLLHHVWINILGNAVKFTPGGGVISVKMTNREAALAHPAKRDKESKYTDDIIAVTITDTGIGMDEDVQKHLFDKFYQGDISHSTEGNGLGMSLVQRILHLCDGQISISSTVGEGTSVTVVLPK